MRTSFHVASILVGCLVVYVLANDPFSRMVDVLNDDTSLQYYAHCFLEKGPCSGDGRAVKRILPEFISTSCAKCSEKQKKMACKIMHTLQQPKYAELWQQFLAKYDPNDLYQVNLESFMQYCRATHHILK